MSYGTVSSLCSITGMANGSGKAITSALTHA
jgi:hypothetical protein